MSQAPSRRGVSLMEVLISIFVTAIGLLGLAALIPVGTYAIFHTTVADRSGACGRAGLREVKIQRMLDPALWVGNPGNGPFAIDPLGIVLKMPNSLGSIPRISLKDPLTGNAMSQDVADQTFTFHDDLAVEFPEDEQRPYLLLPDLDSDYPQPLADEHYTWFLTVTPSPMEALEHAENKRVFTVSVVVCFQRKFNVSDDPDLNGESPRTAEVLGNGWGGGSVKLNNRVTIKENEWIMLYGGGRCHWYRVLSTGVTADNEQLLGLSGPDWDAANIPKPKALVVSGVKGVYTTTIEVDRMDQSLLW